MLRCFLISYKVEICYSQVSYVKHHNSYQQKIAGDLANHAGSKDANRQIKGPTN